MQKVARNSREFPFKKYRSPEATDHRYSADAKLPDLTPVPTLSLPLTACVLKFGVWRTEFFIPHTHTHTHTQNEKCHCPKVISTE